VATTTLGWVNLERKIADPARFTNDPFACEEVGTLETEKTLWPELTEQTGAGTAAYLLHQPGASLTDVESITTPSG